MESYSTKRKRASNEGFYQCLKDSAKKRAFANHLKKQGVSGLLEFLEYSNQYEEQYPDVVLSGRARNENELKIEMKIEELQRLSKLYDNIEEQQITKKMQWDDNSIKRIIDAGRKVKNFQKLLKLTGSHESVSVGEMGMLNDKIFLVNRQVEVFLIYYYQQFEEKLKTYGIRKTESAPTPRNSSEFPHGVVMSFAPENELFRSISSNSDGKGYPLEVLKNDFRSSIDYSPDE